jgi:hypothetical protein
MTFWVDLGGQWGYLYMLFTYVNKRVEGGGGGGNLPNQTTCKFPHVNMCMTSNDLDVVGKFAYTNEQIGGKLICMTCWT